MSNPYAEFGSRKKYLQWLADDHNLPLRTVLAIADLLGESEDFDGLVNACEDAASNQDYQ